MAFTPLNLGNNRGATSSFTPLGQASSPVTPPTSLVSKTLGVFKAVGNALTSSEQAVSGEIAAGLPASLTGEQQLNKANQDAASSDIAFINSINKMRAAGKTLTPQQQAIYNNILSTHSGTGVTQTDLLPHAADTNLQGIGNTLGVGLDVLSAGSYGDVLKGGQELLKTGSLTNDLAKSGTLASKVAAPVLQSTAKQTLGQTIKGIAKKTAVRAGIGAGTGYGYDVSQNLQQGKTGSAALTPGMGTILGGSVPIVIGGIQAGVALTKDSAPRFINSLIKPKQADFSYGKDPGRTVSEMGITGNSLPDFVNNITTAKQGVGQQLGAIYSAPENAKVVINATPEIDKIDTAISDAAKGGKNNQSIVNQLQNIKDAILYEHGVDANGSIIRIGDVPRDLSALSPQEAQDLIQHVADQTQFTGRPSDDKIVNGVLKSIYGGIRDKINAGVSVNSPDVEKLNQQYADLTSAEIATRNRNAIIQRSNMTSPIALSKPLGTGAAITAALLTGGATAIPAVLAGATSAALEKAMETTAVKTRIAAWLGSQSPSTITALIQKNPAIKETLYRLVPKLSSQL